MITGPNNPCEGDELTDLGQPLRCLATVNNVRAIQMKRIPGFHSFIVRQIGEPKHVLRFARDWFVKPLCASSFSKFWHYWNPVYGYVLLFYIYRPLRRLLPRPAAVFLTFIASGFLLHDLPFNLSADLYQGRLGVPSVTILFAVFGALVLLSEALHLDLSRYSQWQRAAANIGWLGAGFVLRKIIVRAL